VSIHLKFLVDVGVGKAVENWLKTQGYDVLPVRELDPKMADLNMAVIEEIFTRYEDQLPGNFSVYQSGRLRIRTP